jgi:hypothetical protein
MESTKTLEQGAVMLSHRHIYRSSRDPDTDQYYLPKIKAPEMLIKNHISNSTPSQKPLIPYLQEIFA